MMKKFLLTLLYSYLSLISWAQIDQQIIDQVSEYPDSFKLYEELSNKINADFRSDEEKAAAIYVWMTQNIAYDVKAFFSGRAGRTESFSYRNEAEKIQKLSQMQREIALTTLKKKKAVCQGYAELYRVLCRACAIECEVVAGYTKTNEMDIGNERLKVDHAWNVIKLDGQWYVVDATWGAGFVDYKRKAFVPAYTAVYFKQSAQTSQLQRFPEDDKWSLTGITFKEFVNQPIYYRSFFTSGISSISPQKGTITKAKKGVINVTVKTVRKLSDFAYRFSNQKYMHKVEGQQKEGELIFNIPVDNNRNAYLYIITDYETLVTYKLRLK